MFVLWDNHESRVSSWWLWGSGTEASPQYGGRGSCRWGIRTSGGTGQPRPRNRQFPLCSGGSCRRVSPQPSPLVEPSQAPSSGSSPQQNRRWMSPVWWWYEGALLPRVSVAWRPSLCTSASCWGVASVARTKRSKSPVCWHRGRWAPTGSGSWCCGRLALGWWWSRATPTVERGSSWAWRGCSSHQSIWPCASVRLSETGRTCRAGHAPTPDSEPAPGSGSAGGRDLVEASWRSAQLSKRSPLSNRRARSELSRPPALQRAPSHSAGWGLSAAAGPWAGGCWRSPTLRSAARRTGSRPDTEGSCPSGSHPRPAGRTRTSLPRGLRGSPGPDSGPYTGWCPAGDPVLGT